MAVENVLQDTEGAVRAWLRTVPTVTALVGQRVFLGVDRPSAYPCVALVRIGGGIAASEGLLDLALLQFDVWGDRHDKAGAFAATGAVVEALHQLHRATHQGVLLHGASVQSWLFQPDDSERARYIITAQVVATPG